MVYIGQCKEIKINTMLNIGKLQQVVSALQVQSLTDCAMRELREKTGISETNLVKMNGAIHIGRVYDMLEFDGKQHFSTFENIDSKIKFISDILIK